MSWLPLAEALPIGRRSRHLCINKCGEDRSMLVSHDHKCYSAYCFRCGKIGYQNKGYQTLAQLKHIKELNKVAREQAKTLRIPSDAEFDVNKWPVEARMWLYKASIYGSRIIDYQIAYSPKSGRVCLPVYSQEGDLIFYQLRRIFGNGPKYLNPIVDKSMVMFWAMPQEYTMSRVVIVEDILSAIRVGKHVPTVSLLGTKISLPQADALSHFDTVTTWLDPDSAGIEGASAIRKLLGLTNKVSNLTSDKDPKFLSDLNIREYLR